MSGSDPASNVVPIGRADRRGRSPRPSWPDEAPTLVRPDPERPGAADAPPWYVCLEVGQDEVERLWRLAQLTPHATAWRSGMDQWQSVLEIPELHRAVGAPDLAQAPRSLAPPDLNRLSKSPEWDALTGTNARTGPRLRTPPPPPRRFPANIPPLAYAIASPGTARAPSAPREAPAAARFESQPPPTPLALSVQTTKSHLSPPANSRLRRAAFVGALAFGVCGTTLGIIALRRPTHDALAPSSDQANAVTLVVQRLPKSESSSQPAVPAISVEDLKPVASKGAPATVATSAPAGERRSGGGDRTFNRKAAASVLGRAAARAARCTSSDAMSVRAIAQFAPSGELASLNFSPQPPMKTALCLRGAFRNARVPAFEGSPVTVAKTVNVGR